MAVIVMSDPPPEIKQMARHAIEMLSPVITSTEADPEAVINQVITDLQTLANVGTDTNVEPLAVDAADLLGEALDVVRFLRAREQVQRWYNTQLFGMYEQGLSLTEKNTRRSALRFQRGQRIAALEREYFEESPNV
ncbi:hypothetical protein GF348_24515 [candidate division KSB3 bacterium]|nr:hypothetical protein [candidate division KSB3 bacterium]